jgi:L-threonylcarbamoyladenylate synthase
MILDGLDASAIALAAKVIRSGGLVGLPTETVYGLAADAENDTAVAQVFKAKGRPADHPLIVHVADAKAVAHFAADVPQFARQLMAAFWPGPLTLILARRAGVASAAAGGQNSIGLRCPSHPVAQALLRSINGGLAAPSANQFGRVSPTTALHVQAEFGADLMILDGGACTVGIESTIIDCTRGAPVLLRPGAITPDQVQARCGLRVLSKGELTPADTSAPRASGTLASHYAPKAPVRLMDARTLQAELNLPGPGLSNQNSSAGVDPLIAIYSRAQLKTGSAKVLLKRMPEDAVAAAQELFSVLRGFDDQGVQLIWIEAPPATPEWDGVRDRMQRAAAGFMPEQQLRNCSRP